MLTEEFEGDCFNWIRQRQPVIIMQWTGITDKHGKDIYEGDLLKFDPVEWGDNDSVFEVTWNNKEGCWEGYGVFDEWTTYCEIVGNIYESAKNKMTYMIIPKNHSIYPFPYNLEDRVKYIKDQINEKIKFDIKLTIKSIKQKVDNINVLAYRMEIKDIPGLKKFKDFLLSFGTKKGGKWIINIR